MTTSENKKRNCHLSIPISLVDLTVFQLKFYTFFKTKYQTILQLLVTYRSLQKFSCYSEVIPIHENNFLLEMSNCRPIFLLSNVNKIFEKLITAEFLEEKKSLCYRQFGFRKDFSTRYAILTLLESIQKAHDNGHFGCRIIIDITKAFDIVSHDKLLEKLNRYDIRVSQTIYSGLL